MFFSLLNKAWFHYRHRRIRKETFSQILIVTTVLGSVIRIAKRKGPESFRFVFLNDNDYDVHYLVLTVST